MKNKLLLVGVFILIMVVAFKVRTVFGEGETLRVCVGNSGFLTVKSSCSTGSKVYELVTGNALPDNSDIAFVGTELLLKKDGSVWKAAKDTEEPPNFSWERIAQLPKEVTVGEILKWGDIYFTTANQIWRLDNGIHAYTLMPELSAM